jgi:ribosomal subunit interface protein
MPIATRIVARNLVLTARDQNRIEEKAAKLNRHLARFPAGSIHLQVAVERLKRRKNEITVALTLRLPSDVLHCQKSAAQLTAAMDGAVRILEREVEKHKSHLRGASAWKRLTRRERQLALERPEPEPPPPPDEKGDQLASMVSGLLRDNYQRLLNYINNKLAELEATGQAPAGALDPLVILEAVALMCLRHPRRKPADMSYLVWFYALAGRELSLAARRARRQGRDEVSLDQAADSDDGIERVDGYDADQPLDVIEHVFEPTGTSKAELTPDTRAAAPDEQASRGDLFAAVRALAGHWPELEREAFELHYVEGLEAFEIAVLKGCSVSSVEQALEAVKLRLREAFFAAAERRQVGVGRLDVGQVMAALEDAAGRKSD